MRKTELKPMENSPWRRWQDAAQYFQLGRTALDNLANKAGAKKKIGRLALYNVPLIEAYLNEM